MPRTATPGTNAKVVKLELPPAIFNEMLKVAKDRETSMGGLARLFFKWGLRTLKEEEPAASLGPEMKRAKRAK